MPSDILDTFQKSMLLNQLRKKQENVECRRNGGISLAHVKGEEKTTTQNKVKPDAILKKFWRDNDRFADLFNATLFDGEMVVDPKDLVETETDVSSILEINGHVETLVRVLDVVKNTAKLMSYVKIRKLIQNLR